MHKNTHEDFVNRVDKIGSEKVYHDERIFFVDITKGIGIILVVCSHVCYQLMSWALPFFIPLFFIVSGYCTIHPVILGRKFQKLILPYVFFSFTLMFIYFDFRLINFIGFAYSRWCLYPLGTEPNVYFLQIGNGPLWFLTSFFVAFSLYKLIQSCSRPWLLAVFYIAVTYALSYLPILLPWSADTAFLMAVFILFGSYIREQKLLDRLSTPLLLGLTLIYSILATNTGNINISVRNYGTSLLLFFPAAVIGSLLLMKLSAIIDGTILGHILQKIGFHSLPIFCIHIPIINLSRYFLSSASITIHPIIDSMLVVVLVLVVTYPLAIVFDFLLEKIKVFF